MAIALRPLSFLQRATVAVVVLLSASGVRADDPELGVHPVETAVTPMVGPIRGRQVLRNDDGGYDVVLRGATAFAKVNERVEGVVEVGLELPGGWKIAKATWVEGERAWWLDLEGHDQVRARLTRDLDGVQVELRDCGRAKDAPTWAPPYAPLPVSLPHGPLR